MNADQFIDKLASDLAPVRRLPRPAWSFVMLSSASGATAVLVGTILLRLRPNHAGQLLRSPLSFLPVLLLATAWLSSAYSLACLRLPEKSAKRTVFSSAVTFVVAFALYLVASFQLSSFHAFVDGLTLGGTRCSIGVMAMSALPGLIAFFFLRRGAPVRPILSAVIAGLSSASLGMFLLAFACRNENPAHLLLWHIFAPAMVLSSIFSFAGSRYLRW